MRDETRDKRKEQIEAAAYNLLTSKGYAGASMLNIAKAAKASNETLYRWYGDKKGLFKAMVQSNVTVVTDALDAAFSEDTDPRRCLGIIAPVLLQMLLGENAVLLNRAAASDHTGELGTAIAEGGRAVVAPRITQLMRRGIGNGSIAAPSPEQACEWFLALLIGDLQIRRVIGAKAAFSPGEVDARAMQGLAAFDRLTKP